MNSMRQPVLVLYHQLLRETTRFSLYNYREYFYHRIRHEFAQHRTERDPSKISALMKRGRQNLEIIRRQVVIGNMYTPEQPSIIENPSQSSS